MNPNGLFLSFSALCDFLFKKIPFLKKKFFQVFPIVVLEYFWAFDMAPTWDVPVLFLQTILMSGTHMVWSAKTALQSYKHVIIYNHIKAFPSFRKEFSSFNSRLITVQLGWAFNSPDREPLRPQNFLFIGNEIPFTCIGNHKLAKATARKFLHSLRNFWTMFLIPPSNTPYFIYMKSPSQISSFLLLWLKWIKFW